MVTKRLVKWNIDNYFEIFVIFDKK